jgi:hypothetical protein
VFLLITYIFLLLIKRYFYSCSLFLGSVATGDLSFTPTQQMPPASAIPVGPLAVESRIEGGE